MIKSKNSRKKMNRKLLDLLSIW